MRFEQTRALFRAMAREGVRYALIGSMAMAARGYPVIRYGPPDGQPQIDFVGRRGVAFAFDDVESEVLDVDGTAVPVATARLCSTR